MKLSHSTPRLFSLGLALALAPACSSDGNPLDGSEGTGGSVVSGDSGGAPGAGGPGAGGVTTGGPGAGGLVSGSSGGASSGGASASAGGDAGVGGAPTSSGSASSAGGATGGASEGSGGEPVMGSGGAIEELPPAAPEGVIPNEPYNGNLPSNKGDWRTGLISPTLELDHHNQPAIINGYLFISGNSRFWMYDISDSTKPKQLSFKKSPDDNPTREAEGHQVTFAKHGNRLYAATIQGYGVDIWDITSATDPKLAKTIKIQGINFGDFTSAVWGLSWQGNHLFVGGTDTGVHVIDATNPSEAKLVGRLANVGGVNAGPLYAIGNVLVVTTPKNNKGIATVDISNPTNPVLLDTVPPGEAGADSYIGAFYRHHAYLLNPIRVYDVLSNPANIQLVPGTRPGGYFEYMSFQDDFMFAGRIRPEPGATKINVSNMGNFTFVRDIYGRRDLSENDDQFTIAVGNLLIMSDDQLSPVTNKYAGTVIAVHDKNPDTKPPAVDWVIPKAGATGQALTTRIGISFTDNIELATVDARSFIVRPVGGQPIAGTFGVTMSVLNFEPNEPLQPGTTYEIILPAGGVKDLVGNGIAEEFKATFTTRT
ncbi:MAG: hypothetical protein B6A08_17000 [Sorangiineae bacterium NIC37A_2]|nr:MAG: hypothetical protein B6A08_17000 [Sorangiineae bacterium NIC37A_2]